MRPEYRDSGMGGPMEAGLDVSIKFRDMEFELNAEADDLDR